MTSTLLDSQYNLSNYSETIFLYVVSAAIFLWPNLKKQRSTGKVHLIEIDDMFLVRLCRVRMHYGHPDVFDRIFHITRGGISKSSRGINLSEDIFAGFLTFKHSTSSTRSL